LQEMEKEVKITIESIISKSKNSPFPDSSSILNHIFSD